MASTAEQVRNIVLSKLEMLQIDYPADLEVSLLEVEQAILNYCNISEVPTELRFVWANMVVDYYRWIAEMATIAEATTPAKSSSPTVLSSIKEGDTSLGFSVDTNSVRYQVSQAHSLSGVLDKYVMNYSDALNRFRRVVW